MRRDASRAALPSDRRPLARFEPGEGCVAWPAGAVLAWPSRGRAGRGREEYRMNPLLPAHLQRELVLASSSPRRADILRMLGFEFEVAPAAVDEEVRGRPEAQAYVRDL